MRKRAELLRRGDVIVCKGSGWYLVESVTFEGSSVYPLGSSDICDDDLPMMLRLGQIVELEE